MSYSFQGACPFCGRHIFARRHCIEDFIGLKCPSCGLFGFKIGCSRKKRAKHTADTNEREN